MTDELVYKILVQLNQQLERIETRLNTIMASLEAPELALTVTRLSSTAPGEQGQVTPGSMILTGREASDYFRGLKQPTVIPLHDLPPWTHMALSEGTWWLLTMN
jgi:hypothetical protein